MTGKEYLQGYFALIQKGYTLSEAYEIIENVKQEMEESKITVWSVKNDKGDLIFNHIENSWVDGNIPQPKNPEFKNQLSWQKMSWNKRFTYLKDGKVLDYSL
jgi:hypothetical protein